MYRNEQKYLEFKTLVNQSLQPRLPVFYGDPLLRGGLIRVYDLVH